MNKNYFTQLDGLRFLAAFAVMVQHWVTNPMNIPAPLGFFGVTLFFVLSGFLISRILFLEKKKVILGERAAAKYFTNFYYRRCLRIFPLYFLVVFLLILFDFGPSRENAAWLVTHTINIKFALQGAYSDWINHFWSLAIEEQYYLFFPLIVFLTPQRLFVRMLIALIIVALLTRVSLMLSGVSYRSIGFVTLSCLDSFGFGGLLAYLYEYKRQFLKTVLKHWLPITAIFSFLLLAIYFRVEQGQDGSYQVVWLRLLVSILSMWLIGRAVFGFTGFVKYFLEHPWISYLGTISYGLYVYHNFAQYLFAELIGERQSLEIYMAPIYFIFTLIVSAISWRFFENPINRIKNRVKPILPG